MRRHKVFIAVLALALVMLAAAGAQAHLLISPVRVVLGGHDRSKVLLLLNTDNKRHTYRLKWKMMKMTDDGTYKDMPLDEKDPHAVPNMVVFTPRQVTLEANARQSVRISLRQPADLPPGEYRGHLFFEELPEPSRKTADSGHMGMDIQLVISVTIPVIVRNGGTPPGAISITNATFPSGNALQMVLNHPQGANSVYGRVVVTEEKDGKNQQIGIVNNIALYPEVSKRVLSIPLSEAVAPGTKLHIAYQGGDEYNGQTLGQLDLTSTR